MTIITALNNNEEEVVLQRMKKNARDNCKPALEGMVCKPSSTATYTIIQQLSSTPTFTINIQTIINCNFYHQYSLTIIYSAGGMHQD